MGFAETLREVQAGADDRVVLRAALCTLFDLLIEKQIIDEGVARYRLESVILELTAPGRGRRRQMGGSPFRDPETEEEVRERESAKVTCVACAQVFNDARRRDEVRQRITEGTKIAL